MKVPPSSRQKKYALGLLADKAPPSPDQQLLSDLMKNLKKSSNRKKGLEDGSLRESQVAD